MRIQVSQRSRLLSRGSGYYRRTATREGEPMIVLGVILVILGVLLSISILYTVGAILLVVGVVLMLMSTAGHAVGGRRHYRNHEGEGVCPRPVPEDARFSGRRGPASLFEGQIGPSPRRPRLLP